MASTVTRDAKGVPTITVASPDELDTPEVREAIAEVVANLAAIGAEPQPISYATRAEATRTQLREALEERLKVLDGWPEDTEEEGAASWNGIQVVTNADLLEVFAQPLPKPSEHAAEVITPARIIVWGICPNCGTGSELSLYIATVLTVSGEGRELKLAAKSKPVNHRCGQMAMRDAVPTEQADLGLGDILEPAVDVDQETGEITETPAPEAAPRFPHTIKPGTYGPKVN